MQFKEGQIEIVAQIQVVDNQNKLMLLSLPLDVPVSVGHSGSVH